MNGCTAKDNVATKYGGAVIYSSAEPTISINNCSFYNNECAELSGVETFRICTGKANIDINHSTLCGNYYFESGNIKINNSMIEAVGNASVNQSFVKSVVDLTSVNSAITKAEHEEFKTLFSRETLGKSNTPYLPLAKSINKVPAMKGKYLESDQTGDPRKSEMVTPGAIEKQPDPIIAPAEGTTNQ